MAFASAACAAALGLLALVSFQDNHPIAAKTSQGSYQLSFSSAQNKAPSGSGSYQPKTELGTSIGFAYKNLIEDSSDALSMGSSSSFGNTDALNGLQSISITFAAGSVVKALDISYGWANDDYYFTEPVSTSDASVPIAFSFRQEEPSFFKLSCSTGVAQISSLSLSYSCVAKANPYGVASQGLSFTLNDSNTYYVSGYSGTDTTVIVPSTYNGVAVTSFGDNKTYSADTPVFSASSPVIPTALIMPSSVVSIGRKAFMNCTKLTSLDLSRTSVASLMESAFDGCSSLSSILLPSTLTSIGQYAFQKNAFPDFFVPSSVTGIGMGAFCGSSAMTMMYLPSSVRSVGDYLVDLNTKSYFPIYCEATTRPSAWSSYMLSSYDTTRPLVFDSHVFYDQVSQFYYSLPTSNPAAGATVIGYVGQAIDMAIPEKLGGYPVVAFGLGFWPNKAKIVSITLPSTVTRFMDGNVDTQTIRTVVNGVFMNFTALKSINIPKGMTKIGSYSFYGDAALTFLYLPSSVVTVGQNALYQSPSCVVECGPDSRPEGWDSAWYVSVKSVTWGIKSRGALSNGLIYHALLDSNGIPYASICGVENPLRYIEIPQTIEGYPVTRIETGAFSWKVQCEAVYIPSSVTTIDSGAITGGSCHYYFQVSSAPSGYSTTLNTYSSYLTWGAEVKGASDGFHYFVDSSGNAEIVAYGGNDANLTIPASLNGYPVSTIGPYGLAFLPFATSLSFPSTLTSVGEYAFASCTGLTDVIWPSSVTEIPFWAFSSCSSLVHVTLPSTLINIKACAFAHCPNFVFPSLPSSLTSIASSAFSLSGITSLTLPDTVLSVSSRAFYGCDKLSSVSLPSTLSSIGDEAFSGCSSLSSVAIPNAVKTLGSKVFSSCSSLTSVTFSNALESIGASAFSDCTSLSSVVLPNTLTTLGSLCFSSCSSLSSVSLSASLTSLSDQFKGCSSLTSLFIPASVSAISASLTNGSGFTAFSIDSRNPYFSVGSNGRVIVSSSTHQVVCFSLVGTDELYIPNTVTNLYDAEFSSYLSKIKIFYIPASVTTIIGRPFSGVKDYYLIEVDCAAPSKPSGWPDDWDLVDTWTEDGDECNNRATVYWGQTW